MKLEKNTLLFVLPFIAVNTFLEVPSEEPILVHIVDINGVVHLIVICRDQMLPMTHHRPLLGSQCFARQGIPVQHLFGPIIIRIVGRIMYQSIILSLCVVVNKYTFVRGLGVVVGIILVILGYSIERGC